MRCLAAFAVLLLTFSTSESCKADDVVAADLTKTADQLVETFQLVLKHHIAPLTLQQMIHSSLAEAYLRSQRPVPASLAVEISAATQEHELREILVRELSKQPHHVQLTFAKTLPHGLRAIGVSVVPTNQQKVDEQIAANRYVGIGIALTNGPYPEIGGVIPGGPADQAGLHQGGRIVEVNGTRTGGLRIEKVIELLRGVNGSEVEIVVRDDGGDQTLSITRGVVPFASVDEPEVSTSGQTARIKLKRVSASNVHELRKIEAKLDQNVRTVILEFTNVSGTDHLHYGQLLGNALIDDAPMGIVLRRDGNEKGTQAEPGALFRGRRLVIRIGNSTHGVLKWIAAGLQDAGQAILFGAPASWSANCNESFQIDDGAYSVSMPVAELRRGDGKPLTVPELAWRFGFAPSLQSVQLLDDAIDPPANEFNGVLYPSAGAPAVRENLDSALDRIEARLRRVLSQ